MFTAWHCIKLTVSLTVHWTVSSVQEFKPDVAYDRHHLQEALGLLRVLRHDADEVFQSRDVLSVRVVADNLNSSADAVAVRDCQLVEPRKLACTGHHSRLPLDKQIQCIPQAKQRNRDHLHADDNIEQPNRCGLGSPMVIAFG